MTKEQKAIEILTKKVDSWKCKRPRNSIILKRLIDEIDTENNAIETVLNMLKGKDKEIDKKNEIIDELVKYIDSNNYVDNEECQFQWDFKIEKCAGNGDCKDCIKQYFERKNEE